MGIGLGIFLIAVGAILAFALTTEPSGLDLDATGWILIVTGIFLVILSLAYWGYRRSERVVEREIYTPVYQPIYTQARVYPRVYQSLEPPVAERIIEREIPRYPAERVIEHNVYEDRPPL